MYIHPCQLTNITSSDSAARVFSKIQEKCVVLTRSSGSDLTRAKHSGVVAPRTKFLPDWPKCF